MRRKTREKRKKQRKSEKKKTTSLPSDEGNAAGGSPYKILIIYKEVFSMKKTMKKAVEKTLVADANRTSCAIVYQPKVPAKMEKFKKG